MKIKGGFIILLLFFSQFNIAQGQYFNLRIDFMGYNQAEVGFAIEKMNDGNYIIFHSGRTESGDNLGIARTILNPQGVVLNEMIELDDNGALYTGWNNTSTKIPGGYVSSGSKSWFSASLESLITLNRYDEQGELMWMKFYGDSIKQSIGRAATRQIDGTLAAAGSITQSSDNVDGFLLLTDSFGVLIDLKFYGGNGIEAFTSVYPTSDGGYVLGGYNWGSPGNKNHYIVKTDSLGNQQWSRVIGTSLDDCWANVIQTSDDNYVFCGCRNAELQNTDYKKLFLAKLGNTGQPIWQYTYQDHYSDNHQLRSVKELDNGDLVACGYTFGGSRGVLLRTDADGNELWYREYAHPSQPGIGYPHLVHDFIIEDDGGFVATGWLWSPPNGDIPGQDLWVFRTDSMGCLVPGCHIVDNIQMHSNEVAVSLYPNPVQNQLSVHIKAGELPHGATIELYDMQGRQHLSTLLEPGARTYIIDMRHYASGVYLLHCKTPTEMLWTGKVVKN
jgi:hypothetical protein